MNTMIKNKVARYGLARVLTAKSSTSCCSCIRTRTLARTPAAEMVMNTTAVVTAESMMIRGRSLILSFLDTKKPYTSP